MENLLFLVATPNGMLIEIPWMLFDPRRPFDLTPMDREEGLIMYTPEIMVNFESVINYYKYVYNIRGIHTVATGLESTSVVFAYGLGMKLEKFVYLINCFFSFRFIFYSCFSIENI